MLQFPFCFFFVHIRISSIFFRYFIYLFFASNIWQLVVVFVVVFIVLCVGKMRKMKCKYLRCVLYFIVFYLNIYSTQLSGEYIQLKFLLLLLFLYSLWVFVFVFCCCFCFCFTVLYSTIKFNYCWSFALGGNLQLCAVIYVAANCQVSRGGRGGPEGSGCRKKATYFHITRANRLSVYGPEMSSKSHLGCQIITLSPTKVY